VSILRHNDVGTVGGGFVVSGLFVPVREHDYASVLLDLAGLSQVRHRRLP